MKHALAVVLLLSGFGSKVFAEPGERTSIVAVVANPSQYEGRKIQLSGFLVWEEERHALFLSPDDAENGLTAGGIEIGLDPGTDLRSCNRKYASIVGVFHAKAESAWPMEKVIGMPVAKLDAVEEIRSPPYRYPPADNVIVCFKL